MKILTKSIRVGTNVLFFNLVSLLPASKTEVSSARVVIRVPISTIRNNFYQLENFLTPEIER